MSEVELYLRAIQALVAALAKQAGHPEVERSIARAPVRSDVRYACLRRFAGSAETALIVSLAPSTIAKGPPTPLRQAVVGAGLLRFAALVGYAYPEESALPLLRELYARAEALCGQHITEPGQVLRVLRELGVTEKGTPNE